MLNAVTFDLWQTLIVDTPEGLRKARADRVRGMAAVLAREGHAANDAAVDRAYDTVGERLETLWAEQRDLGSRGQVRMLLEALELADRVPMDGPVMEALDEAYRLPILAALPVANAGAREVLETFSRRGLRLALICNTGRTPGSMLRLVLDRLGLKALSSGAHVLGRGWAAEAASGDLPPDARGPGRLAVRGRPCGR